MDLIGSKYRITYEAFSKFSGSVSKARTIDELASVVKRNLKYFFDFKLLRISIFDDGKPVIFSFQKNEYNVCKFKKNIQNYEKKLLLTEVPFRTELDLNLINNLPICPALIKPYLWGWYFNYNRIKVCTSLISDETKVFNNADVEILHLLVDSFITKYQHLLLQDKLNEKNKSLEKAVKLIEKKNLQIHKIVNNQKETIYNRTKEIRKKNSTLLEISQLNAHNVREPLSRILGLIDISEHFEPFELSENILQPLKISATELDNALKIIVDQSTQEISEDYAS